MGSLRRGLILALLPSAAWAEVCDKERPAWDGAPVTPVTEAVALFSSLPALVLICATLLALRFRHQWGGLIVVLLWSFLISAHVSLDRACENDLFRTVGTLPAVATLSLQRAALESYQVIWTSRSS